MIAIAKINNEEKTTFLYKDRNKLYSFSHIPNVFFNTEEEALNFIHYNYEFIKPKILEGDKIEIIKYNVMR